MLYLLSQILYFLLFCLMLQFDKMVVWLLFYNFILVQCVCVCEQCWELQFEILDFIVVIIGIWDFPVLTPET